MVKDSLGNVLGEVSIVLIQHGGTPGKPENLEIVRKFDQSGVGEFKDLLLVS